MALTKVFETIRIGKLEVKNRIARTAHGEHLGAHYASDEFVAYHTARAKGGCGLSIFGAAEVDPSSIAVGGLWDDAVIPRFQKLAKSIAPYGMRAFQQLWHGGHHYLNVHGGPPPAPGTVPSPYPFSYIPVVGVPMDHAEIARLVGAYATAARRCQEGGLHGVEIHSAHGYLPYQFLSPVTNTRTDEYGGSLENRMRFLIEVCTAVRKAVGPDFVVGCRLSATQKRRGLHEDELNLVATKMQSLGIDYISAGLGDYWRMETMIGGMQTPMGYEVSSARLFLRGIRIPKIVAGRFRTLEEADQLLREGDFDLVGMVRAQIADPDLINKTMQGHTERVRPCIACNQGCIGSIMRGGGLHCTVNAAAGYEGEYAEDLIRPVANPKRVVVVGGGPAGLEAARIAAMRGHRVRLYEAAARLGGNVNAAMRVAQQTALGDIIVWLEAEIRHLGVDVQLSSYVEPEEVLADKPDAVIIATGSRPRMDGWQLADPDQPIRGVDQPHVLSSVDLILSPPKSLGKSAVVLDTVGHFEGVVCAIHLIQQGLAVTYVTSHRAFAAYVRSTDRDDTMLEKLHAGDFTLLINHLLVSISPGECTIRPVTSERTRTIAADTVVLVTSNQPNRELFDLLKGKVEFLSLAGDALSPRDMQMAILEGHREARSIQ